jgi:ABC-type branched-subunit amino acid transport system ATPase component/ABC-type branched-subunit amino acid transport system permease subunit
MSRPWLDVRSFGPPLVVVVLAAGSFALDGYPKYVIAILFIAMLIGSSLSLLVGMARCIMLASGAMMATGAYASSLCAVHLSFSYLPTLIVALACGAVAGLLIAAPGVRFRGHNLAMITLVFQSVWVILLREAKGLTGGAEGMHVPVPVVLGWQVRSDSDYIVLIGAVAAVALLFYAIIARGPFGRNLRASAIGETAAEAYGISTRSYLAAAFVITSMLIALAGALAAPRIRILDTESFGVSASISMLAYPIVGGMQSIWGGLVGGLLLRALPEGLRSMADYQELLFAALVLAVIAFFPGGLAGLSRRFTSWARVGPRSERVPSTRAAGGNRAVAERPAPIQRSGGAPQAEVLLDVSGVDKRFGSLQAVSGASLVIRSGELHGLIGPNGAGKTSLFNIVSGFLSADAGEIRFAGRSLLGVDVGARIHLGITRTFQNVATFRQLSCLDNVLIGLGRNNVLSALRGSADQFVFTARFRDARAAAEAALASVDLAHEASTPAGTLSLGNQRRLEIARAIVSRPRLILLDEPVSGVSEEEIAKLRELLLRVNQEQGIAMLVVEHNIPFVAGLCSSLSVMGAGEIVATGRPSDVLTLPTVRTLYFGEGRAA